MEISHGTIKISLGHFNNITYRENRCKLYKIASSECQSQKEQID